VRSVSIAVPATNNTHAARLGLPGAEFAVEDRAVDLG
jgi:hypothetical protein